MIGIEGKERKTMWQYPWQRIPSNHKVMCFFMA